MIFNIINKFYNFYFLTTKLKFFFENNVIKSLQYQLKLCSIIKYASKYIDELSHQLSKSIRHYT